MGVVEDLQGLKAQKEDLERRRARREADLELARSRRDEALSTLQEQFGVASVDEARALAQERHAEVQSEIETIAKALEEVPTE